MTKTRIGILTGGGDAPGLNGIIESLVRSLNPHQFELVGIVDGFEGIFGLNSKILTAEMVRGAHNEAGTLLGTSNKSAVGGREQLFLENYRKLQLEGLVALGGDGTFAGLQKVSSEIRIIGVPKTIDNDLPGTDITFGFDTACSVVAESVDALRATANSHRRIMVVETMGRTAGWIALGAGLASFADAILIPERPFDRKLLLEHLANLKKTQRGSVIVVSEGAFPIGENPKVAFTVASSPQSERYGGISEYLARWIEREIGWDSRHVILGHLQRSRAPTTTDRFLTISMGVMAAQLVEAKNWNQAVVYRQGKVQTTSLSEIMTGVRLVDPNHKWVQTAKKLGIFI